MIKSFIQNVMKERYSLKNSYWYSKWCYQRERRAVREAGLAGAREVYLIDEPVAVNRGIFASH